MAGTRQRADLKPEGGTSRLCGHLEVLQYAHAHGCPWGSNTCVAAAGGGHVEVLRYAHEHGCPWDRNSNSAAAEGGHLEALRYAHVHGCPWDSETCSAVAEGGHLEALWYAHTHGCEWDSNTCTQAAYIGHLEVLRYAHEHGCPMDVDECLDVAEQYGHAAVPSIADESTSSGLALLLTRRSATITSQPAGGDFVLGRKGVVTAVSGECTSVELELDDGERLSVLIASVEIKRANRRLTAMLCGLAAARPELNGRKVRLLSWVGSSGRLRVQLDQSSIAPLSVRHASLLALGWEWE
ncbi:hypothetical protein T492DRAFT_915073 [Pavlovales sp. CCMP2436]|nr:hypothetical protein T492DRAFT_915073 [Pavlovales sp. CCMP2436]